MLLFALALPNLVCQQYFVRLAHMTTILWELPPIQLLHNVAEVKHCSKHCQTYIRLRVLTPYIDLSLEV